MSNTDTIADSLDIIPLQYEGRKIIARATMTTQDAITAKAHFTKAADRLKSVNSWHALTGALGGRFQLIDENFRAIDRQANRGDYIRIDIPGPGSGDGDGFDWVRIEDMKSLQSETTDAIGFRVRPCPNPFKRGNNIAHFYSEDATSCFITQRTGNDISAIIVDSNLLPNTHSTNLTDRVRHAAIAVGAMSVFSKIQWQHLVNGFIR